MADEKKEHKVLYPNVGSNVLFGADYRVALTFFRRNPGVMILPWDAPFCAMALVGFAYLGRRWFLWLIGYEGNGWLATVLDPTIGFEGVWLIFGAVLVAWTIDPALESARRTYEEEDVFSDRGDRSLYFVGWPWLINAHAFLTLSPIDQRRKWRRTTLTVEPLIGLSVAAVTYLVQPAFGIWLGWCVLLLRGSSAGIIYRERQQRLNFEQSLFHAKGQQQVLKEIKKKSRRKRSWR